MLHALLHNKLDETTPEPQRLEDTLTSTVFGTLALVGADNVLAKWLQLAKCVDGSRGCTPMSEIRGIWFWPRLALAEPDVVIQLGDRLFVIEAKFRSGRHDTAHSDLKVPTDDEPIADQLHRQWASLQPEHVGRGHYPHDLREAIAHCSLTLIYVVDARRQRRAEREFRESASRLPPTAALRLLTWQSLDELLARDDQAASRWSSALRQYFELVGLQGFTGVQRSLQAHEMEPEVACAWKVDAQVFGRSGLTKNWQAQCIFEPPIFSPARSWHSVDRAAERIGLIHAFHELHSDGASTLLPAQRFHIIPGIVGLSLHDEVAKLVKQGLHDRLRPATVFSIDMQQEDLDG